MKKINPVTSRETAMNIIVMSYFVVTAWASIKNYIQHDSLSSLLFTIYISHFAFFALVRRHPSAVTQDPAEWLVAIAGSFSILLLSPSNNVLSPLGIPLQAIGLCITFAGLISLNRSYAIVPANRGIKTTGMYQFVRHPLYAGYVVSDIGVILSQFSYYNLVIVAVAIAFILLRIRYEEAFLRQDTTYVEFCQKTRYRIIPYIW